MPDITESEARKLLERPQWCHNAGGWVSVPAQVYKRKLESGLVDSTGSRTGLYVNLNYLRRARSRFISYTFSVLRGNKFDVDRVYQLTVVCSAKPLKDKHRQCHEHLGNSRYIGDPEWQKWRYDEVLMHFCERANITFVPMPDHPDTFKN